MLAADRGQRRRGQRRCSTTGADPNATEIARGETALMFAANYNRVDAIKALLAGGANFNVTTKVVGPLRPDTRARGGQGGGQGQGGQGQGGQGQGGPAHRAAGTRSGATGGGRQGRGPGGPPAAGALPARLRAVARDGRWRWSRIWRRAAARSGYRRRHASVPFQRARQRHRVG